MASEMIPALLDNRLEAERMKAAQLVVSDNINDLVKDISTKDIPMQLRAFLLENARIELVQLAKMTNSLHDLEDIFFARALDEAESTDMKSLGEMVKIGTAAVERSLDTINSIVNGKGASNNIYINQSTTKVVNQGTSVVLADKNSAEKIRTIAAKMAANAGISNADMVNALPVPDMDAEFVEAKKDENPEEQQKEIKSEEEQPVTNQ